MKPIAYVSGWLRSTQKDIELLLIWGPVASLGVSNTFEGDFGEKCSAYFPATRHWRTLANGDPKCTSPAVVRVVHQVCFYTGVSQRRGERQRRFLFPLARVCHGACPQWIDNPQPRYGWRYLPCARQPATYPLLPDSKGGLGWPRSPH